MNGVVTSKQSSAGGSPRKPDAVRRSRSQGTGPGGDGALGGEQALPPSGHSQPGVVSCGGDSAWSNVASSSVMAEGVDSASTGGGGGHKQQQQRLRKGSSLVLPEDPAIERHGQGSSPR